MKNGNRIYLVLAGVAVAAYLIHKILFSFVFEGACNESGFLESTYIFYAVCSALIVFSLGKIRTVNPDYIGYSFLVVTCVKMAAAYSFYQILSDDGTARACRMSYFAAFLIFLAVETYAAIRILNRK